MKPKVSIHKITQNEYQNLYKKKKSCPKIKIIDSFQQTLLPQSHISKHNIPKQQKTFHYESQQDTFIGCINQYIEQLDKNKNQQNSFRQKSRKSITSQRLKYEQLHEKLLKEKIINKNLQKNLIDMQKVLWKRGEKIQKLQKAYLHEIDKENKSNNYSKQLSKSKHTIKYKKTNKFEEQQSSDIVQSCLYTQTQDDSKFDQLYKRRKTEAPSELQKIINKSLGIKNTKKYGELKHIF